MKWNNFKRCACTKFAKLFLFLFLMQFVRLAHTHTLFVNGIKCKKTHRPTSSVMERGVRTGRRRRLVTSRWRLLETSLTLHRLLYTLRTNHCVLLVHVMHATINIIIIVVVVVVVVVKVVVLSFSYLSTSSVNTISGNIYV